MIRENGGFESEDEADCDDILPLEDTSVGDEEFGADYGEMLGLVARRALSLQVKRKKKYSGRTSFTLVAT